MRGESFFLLRSASRGAVDLLDLHRHPLPSGFDVGEMLRIDCLNTPGFPHCTNKGLIDLVSLSCHFSSRPHPFALQALSPPFPFV